MSEEMPEEIWIAENEMYKCGGLPKYIATEIPIFSQIETKYIRADLKQQDVNAELLEALKGIEAIIRQKKGFYSISVGHDPVKIAHKAGVNKGLDVVHEIVKQAISRAEQKQTEE